MYTNTKSKSPPDPEDRELTVLQRLCAESLAFIENNDPAAIASLRKEMQGYRTVLDNITQGICFFNGEQQLILSNRRYAEIYHLNPQDIPPGTTLREIVERRAAAGAGPAAGVEDFMSEAEVVNHNLTATTWTTKLTDGREIVMWNQHMPDGGWVSTHEDITESKKKSTSLQTLIDWVPEMLFVKDTESRFIVANEAIAAEMPFVATGEPVTRASMIGKSDFDLFPRKIAQQFRDTEVQIMQSGQRTVDLEELSFDRDGNAKWISMTKVPLRDDDGEIFGLIGIGRNITQQKKDESLRDGQAHLLKMIALNAPLKDVLDHLVQLVEDQLTGIIGSILLLDNDGIHLRHGSAPNLPEAYCKAIDGVAIGPNVGSCGTAAYRQKPVIVSDIMSDPLWADFRDLAAQYNFRSCWSTPILSHDGEVLGTFAMYSPTVRKPTAAETRLIDITTRTAGLAMERKQAEDGIQFQATHDVLTGLPNRSLLKDRLTQAISHAERYGYCVSVVFIDLDKFKDINDSLGHNAGDELLKTVANRMVNSLRSTDTVVRLGGDEFVIVLSGQPKNIDSIVEVLHKIRTTIAEPIHLEGHELNVTCSIGLANYPDDGTDAASLLANADAAMYRAKETGRNNFQFYSPELKNDVHSNFIMQEDLRQALARSEFVLDYQPQVDLRTGKIFAVEALVRWKHPTLGMIPPGKFIPLAEETGLIVPIGDWVLQTACKQNKAWQDAGLPLINVSVNISARQFKEKNWVNRISHALLESGLEAKYLELEITESLIMKDIDQAVSMMKRIQQFGVQIAIDDFGTGYSSLIALKNFSVARLKIDKSFVDEITNSEKDKSITSVLIMLGQKLNTKVIAEGVETDEQIKFLNDNNCDEMQGYHFSRPISAQGVEQLLKNSDPKFSIAT
ncbi:MAG: EAL domain-containing protein [Pseudomonadota bacterium]|nr:EAL domain-containing protein [Pseudomonadota bacterium]